MILRKTRLFFLFCLIVSLSMGVYFSYSRYQSFRKGVSLRKRKVAWQVLQRSIRDEISRFKGEAGVVVKDLGTGWEFSYEEDKLFASASLAKIPLMAVCFLACRQGRIRLDDNMTLKARDKLTGSGILKGMPSGTTCSVERLIGLMIYDSDNTAANMLTNLLGIDYLNNSFKAFGLKATSLSRKIADFNSRDKGIENYTTAQDMAYLLERIYRRNLVNKDVSERCIGTMKLSRQNERIPKYLPAEITVAHKTGLERSVCHDAGIVFTRSGDFIIVALTKHADSNSMASKEFIAKVAAYSYNYAAKGQ